MRSDLIVLPTPAFDEHPCFGQRVEDLSVQQLVPELPVERFHIAVLPRASGLDDQGLYPELLQPLPDSLGRKLRTVVGPDVIRKTTVYEELSQTVQHIG